VITQFQGTAKFNRDASKKIIGITINAGGYLLEGTRTEEGLTVTSGRVMALSKQGSR
jgi:hypothetical protein